MWLVIGYGNTLRGDDGAGQYLAEELARQLPAARAKVLWQQQLTPELAFPLSAPGIDKVLFIDACRELAEPYCFSRLEPAAINSCGHQMSPELLLQISKELYGHNVSGWLLRLQGLCFDYRTQLSGTARTACEQATRAALKFLTAAN